MDLQLGWFLQAIKGLVDNTLKGTYFAAQSCVLCKCDSGSFFLLCPCSPFMRNLFPEDVSTDKRGRPTTASNKIKVNTPLQELLKKIKVSI